MLIRILAVLVVTLGGIFLAPAALEACTRCVYVGPDGMVVIGRSMDWVEDTGTNLYTFPRGMYRDGAAGPNSINWTSKYGSVVCAFYGVATVDGMNEKGLVANTLYLVESDYGKPTSERPNLSIAAWAQYVLDNFATVDEAVTALAKEPFTVIAPMLPNKMPAQGHLSISDPSGDSAILEYIDGKLEIHHGRQYVVMTNSPNYDQQLALDTYWEEIGGDAMLPGTARAADRFARTSFYIKAIAQPKDMDAAVAAVFSVIRGASVPLGITTPGEPNIASTLWRTVYDQKERVMYFDSATSPTVFWMPLDEIDFSQGAPVKMLNRTGGENYTGNAVGQFQVAAPFEFLPADGK
jgi:choloylglycine hydrolase